MLNPCLGQSLSVYVVRNYDGSSTGARRRIQHPFGGLAAILLTASLETGSVGHGKPSTVNNALNNFQLHTND